MTQITAQIAIDKTGNSDYSDLMFTRNYWTKLNNNSNWRFLFNTINNLMSYRSYFSITHAYNNIGLYSLSLTLLSSNVSFYQIINITDSKLKKMIEKVNTLKVLIKWKAKNINRYNLKKYFKLI